MAVSLYGIRKAFGDSVAVEEVTATIEDGEFFVVLGPSGCGKSTLLRMIAGLETLDAGEISLGGRSVAGPGVHVPPEARDIGFVFQSYALWPHMDVRDNVAFPIENAGRTRKAARESAERHLATVALQDFAARRPAELSGGQRQRVALARCLAGGARTILMDEPLANLDPHLRASMEEEIHAFHREARATTLYITHDQREAMALASRVAVMARGRFQQVGTPQELYDRPTSEEVARFIGRAAVPSADLADDGSIKLGGQHVSVTSAARPGSAKVVIRPGDIRLGSGPLSARLERVFYRGGTWEGLAAVEGLSEPLPVESARPLRDGETVALSIETGWVLPDLGSETPGHDAGRQALSEPVE